MLLRPRRQGQVAASTPGLEDEDLTDQRLGPVVLAITWHDLILLRRNIENDNDVRAALVWLGRASCNERAFHARFEFTASTGHRENDPALGEWGAEMVGSLWECQIYSSTLSAVTAVMADPTIIRQGDNFRLTADAVERGSTGAYGSTPTTMIDGKQQGRNISVPAGFDWSRETEQDIRFGRTPVSPCRSMKDRSPLKGA